MTTPYHDEDAAIMRERRLLCRFWENEIEEDAQARIAAYLDATPPEDVCGHQYVVTPCTAFNQVQVERPVQYAWSQIYATLRFNLNPITDVQEVTWRDVALTTAKRIGTKICIFPEIDPWMTPHTRLIVYATDSHELGVRDKFTFLRPVNFHTAGATPIVLDFWDSWKWRYGVDPHGLITASFCFLDEMQMPWFCPDLVTFNADPP